MVVSVVVSLMLLLCGSVWAQFHGGTGEESDPWQITTAFELDSIRNYLGTDHEDKHFKLMNDIDLGIYPYNDGEGWEPIGDSWTSSFNGKLNGNGFEIVNLYINRDEEQYIGLFGNIGVESEITDLGLVDIDITGAEYVGGLAGDGSGMITGVYCTGELSGNRAIGGLLGGNNATIEDSYTTVRITGENACGGLVGFNGGEIRNSYSIVQIVAESNGGGIAGYNAGKIYKCYSTAQVTGSSGVGGLAGRNSNGDIEKSFSEGNIYGERMVGGLVGGNGGPALISASYSVANVWGSIEIGGLAGVNGGGDPTIINSFSMGNVQGNESVGGLVGKAFNSSVINSYSTGQVLGDEAGWENIGGFIGHSRDTANIVIENSFWDMETSGLQESLVGEGKSTAELKQAATFTGWDFDSIWTIDETLSYPYLRWQEGPVVKALRNRESAPIHRNMHVFVRGSVLTIETGHTLTNATVSVYTLTGKRVFVSNGYSGNKQSVKLPFLASGMFQYVVVSECGWNGAGRFVVKR
ncbi:GLUG motif-containing protein [Chitinispirillales bacterium ANBcel5]|uniref:GLUG motif-containing protein n=1 Tax=Cellulosispirillum alkaliphilum TaxID=3039283 RepID=UPI002A4FA864|nr:GLUG motif-containing protein [Chitinispirillales bacterium ANBcel5]